MPTRTKTLPLAPLDPGPGNERSATDAEAIRRPGESIRPRGLLQRLSVPRNKDGRYMVVAGHRRLQKTPAQKWKDTERTARRLAAQRVTEALVARLDEVALGSHVLWLPTTPRESTP